MKNTFKIFTLAALITVSAVSCNLDRYPYDSIEQSQSFQTMKDATTLNTGLYALLRQRVYGIYMFSTDVQADLLNATLDFGNRNGAPHKWTTFLADDYTIRDTWTGYYYAITNVNNVLDNIGKIVTAGATEDASIALYKGEAYLMRAFYYHQLIQRWGKDYEPSTAATDLGVPLVLAFDITLRPNRATIAEVYAQILADIAQAKNLLITAGAKSSNKLTKDCVTALEARVLLCMHNWTGAATAANSLISGGTYPLVNTATNFKKMWTDDTSTEVICQMFMSQPSELGTTINNIYLGLNAALAKYVPDFVPQQWVIDLYQDADIRKNVYLEKKPLFIAGVNYPNIWCVNKYPGNPVLFTAATTNYQHKPNLFRVAEMYLISAEAAAQTTATESAALATLNQLRTARGLTALTGLTGTALMNSIKDERLRELLCEGTRLDDLKRWKMGVVRKAPQNLNLITPGADFEQKSVPAGDPKFVWGIPANDITTNPNMVQNSGW
jgi:hypothetical protein